MQVLVLGAVSGSNPLQRKRLLLILDEKEYPPIIGDRRFFLYLCAHKC